MLTEDPSRVHLLSFETALERALRTLVDAAGALPGVRHTHAWRLGWAVSTERDPSDMLMREAIACLCEELEGRGDAGRLREYQVALCFVELRREAA